MKRITIRRMAVASLASAAAFFVVPIVGGLFELGLPSHVNIDGTPDNAPVRAAGILLVLSPAIYLVVASAAFVGGVILDRLHFLKPGIVAAIVMTLGCGVAGLMVIDRPFGWGDRVYYFFGFAALLLATFGLSAFTWWKVAMANISQAKA